MLSRVAERMYWIGRYLERCEDTARLVGVNATLMLDLPKGTRPSWPALIAIAGAEPEFHAHYQNADERNIVKFLLADTFNPSSIISSTALARENARTTREVMPSEAWERINNLHLHARENAASGVLRRGRHEFIENIISACQQITGMLHGTMSHDRAFQFFVLGQSLERADMTTRIVDVASLIPEATAPDGTAKAATYESVLWMSVLRSLSAFQMYRQNMRERVNGEDVLSYILHDQRFPRAVAFCLDEMESCLRHLPRPTVPLKCLGDAREVLHNVEIDELLAGGLGGYLDDLQREIGVIHAHIESTWFSADIARAGT